MAINKSVILALICGTMSLWSNADTPWRLPEVHSMIADAHVDANMGIADSFSSLSLSEARRNSPFADMLPDAPAADNDVNPVAEKMVDYAAGFLGTRYRLGASGPKAFDCSGFTSYVYRNFGITLHRSSGSQFTQGEKVAVANLRPGDLLFFSSRSSGRGNVGHVAMVVSVDQVAGTCRFIHASTKRGVTYQTFPDNGYYQRHYLGARRILGTELDTTADVAVR